MRFATVILAAGASVRMARAKLLLPWGKTTILSHLVQQWTDLGAEQIGVVVEQGSEVGKVAARIEDGRCKIDHILNPHPELGMWSSVVCAARWSGWKAAVTHYVITLGDQPHVGFTTLRAVLSFAAENADSICQPARNGRGRHPVVLPTHVFAELANEDPSPQVSRESGERPPRTLKEFLHARESKRKMLDSNDPALDLDIDTPADYEKALNFANL